MNIVVIALFGGLGAVARLIIDGHIKQRAKTDFPLGTLTVNLIGSLILGVITELALGGSAGPELRLVMGTGFCGGFTTFSTAHVDAIKLARAGRPTMAGAAVAANAVGCVVIAALGFLLANWAFSGITN